MSWTNSSRAAATASRGARYAPTCRSSCIRAAASADIQRGGASASGVHINAGTPRAGSCATASTPATDSSAATGRAIDRSRFAGACACTG